MSITINDLASTFAANRLNRSQNGLQDSFAKLSSGKRVNSAADDAAGLAIATQLAAQLLGSQQAYNNSNNAISYVQTAEGALGEVDNISQRIRELSVQASNGILSDQDRQNIQTEVTQLQEEAARIFSSTEFNGQNPFTENGSVTFQVGNDAGDSVSLQTADLQQQFTDLGFFDIDVSTAAGAQSALGVIDQGLDVINSSRSDYGAFNNRMEAVGRNLLIESENLAASQSRIMDADYAAETANRTRNLILQNAGIASLAQANVSSGLATYLLKG